MKSNVENLLEFMKGSEQFTIPIYQRNYSWKSRECDQLWDDILAAGKDENVKKHFTGSVIYIEEEHTETSGTSPFFVIDGQQRLTTIMLLLEALARSLSEGDEPVEGFSDEKIRRDYLLTPEGKGERMILNKIDRETLIPIMERRPHELLLSGTSGNIMGNSKFLRGKVSELNDIESLCKGLLKLTIVCIELERGIDHPQLIFETMNYRGLDLSSADLIRNFVLMGLKRDRQEELYHQYWCPMAEKLRLEESDNKHFDLFMEAYITMHTGKFKGEGEHAVYENFKTYARPKMEESERGVDDLMKDICTFAHYYYEVVMCEMRSEARDDLFLLLPSSASYALLLKLRHKIRQDGEFNKAIRLMESFAFRRQVCRMQIRFNKVSQVLGNDFDLNELKTCLCKRVGLPSDPEFREGLMEINLRNDRMRKYWLRRMQNHFSDYKVRVNHDLRFTDPNIHIDFVMPKRLTHEWTEYLGKMSTVVHENWLNRIGNLTLILCEPNETKEFRKKSFEEKLDGPGGYRESFRNPQDGSIWICLNKSLKDVEKWDVTAMRERTKHLAEKAIEVWRFPKGS